MTSKVGLHNNEDCIQYCLTMYTKTLVCNDHILAVIGMYNVKFKAGSN